MKNLTLDVDDLMVGSFATVPREGENGRSEAFSTETVCRNCADLP